MDERLTFREFVEKLVDLVNENPEFADVPCMVAGNGTFAHASGSCVELKDVPETKRTVNTRFDMEKGIWLTREEVSPAHKVVVVSAPEQASLI